jgi:hypothetical protein
LLADFVHFVQRSPLGTSSPNHPISNCTQGWAWWYTPIIPAIQEKEVRESRSEAGLGKLMRLSEKQTKKQKHWGLGSSGTVLV